MANNLEKRIEDEVGILEITSRLSAIRSIPNASLLNATLETLHGIPEDADLEKRRIAQNIISNYGDIDIIGFIMPNGDLYLAEPYSRQENRISYNLAFRDYYKGVLNTNETFLEVLDSGSSGQRQVHMAVPVFSDDNTLIGIWVGGVDLGVVNQELQSLSLTENQRIVYVDSNDTKIADSDKQLAANTSESFSNLTSFQNAIDGKSGTIIEEVNQEMMPVSYHPVEALHDRWAILWIQPVSSNNDSES